MLQSPIIGLSLVINILIVVIGASYRLVTRNKKQKVRISKRTLLEIKRAKNTPLLTKVMVYLISISIFTFTAALSVGTLLILYKDTRKVTVLDIAEKGVILSVEGYFSAIDKVHALEKEGKLFAITEALNIIPSERIDNNSSLNEELNSKSENLNSAFPVLEAQDVVTNEGTDTNRKNDDQSNSSPEDSNASFLALEDPKIDFSENLNMETTYSEKTEEINQIKENENSLFTVIQAIKINPSETLMLTNSPSEIEEAFISVIEDWANRNTGIGTTSLLFSKAKNQKRLIPFMKANNLPSSIEVRKIMASYFGVEAYSGTEKENNILRQKLGELTINQLYKNVIK